METTTPPTGPSAAEHGLRPVRFDGERCWALALEQAPGEGAAFVDRAEAAVARARSEGAALVYGFVEEAHATRTFTRLGWTSLGPAPVLRRHLRLSSAAEGLPLPSTARSLLPDAPLLLPFGRRRRPGVREITVADPRVTRLWDRFSIDVPVAVERNARWVGPRIFERAGAGYRVFIFEDGDRYVIRALCVFRVTVEGGVLSGRVVELLHDRSVAGMRAASHLLGLALRAMSDAGAATAAAWSFVHSGSFPILARHAFLPGRGGERRRELGVCALAPDLSGIVTQRHHWYLSGLDFADE